MKFTLIQVPRLRRMSLRVTPEGIVVRAGRRVSERAVQEFVQKNTAWIEKQQSKLSAFRPLTDAEVLELRVEAKKFLPRRVEELAQKLGFTYKSVTCRHQKSRWGSCSHRNSISLNIELMRLPARLCDYIIVHELTHTRHKHHQKAFWHHLEEVLPGAHELDREMKQWKIGYEKVI